MFAWFTADSGVTLLKKDESIIPQKKFVRYHK